MKRLNIVILVLFSTVTYSQEIILNNFYQSDMDKNNYTSIIIKEDSLNYYTTINQYIENDFSVSEISFKNIKGTLVNKKDDNFTPIYFKGKMTSNDFDIRPQYFDVEVKVDEQKRWVWHSVNKENGKILQDSLRKQASQYAPTLADYNIFLLLKKINFSKVGNKSPTFSVMSLYSEYHNNNNYLKYVGNEEIKVNKKKIQTKVILLLENDYDFAHSAFWIDSKNNIIRYNPTATLGNTYTLVDKNNQ